MKRKSVPEANKFWVKNKWVFLAAFIFILLFILYSLAQSFLKVLSKF